jgi:hypothetical protein
MVAASTALRYADLWLFDRRDQFAIGHLLGPSIRLWSAWHDMWFRSSARASLDFASIRSLAFPEWSSAHGADGVKTVLDKHGYQMTFGGSGELSAGVGYRGLEVGASASFGQYESVEGVDRWEEQVTGDVHGSEWISERSAWVGYTAAEAPVTIRLSVNDLERRSTIEAVDVERWDRRFGGLIATSF